MSELENLQKQLAACHDPKKQMALMTRIKFLVFSSHPLKSRLPCADAQRVEAG